MASVTIGGNARNRRYSSITQRLGWNVVTSKELPSRPKRPVTIHAAKSFKRRTDPGGAPSMPEAERPIYIQHGGAAARARTLPRSTRPLGSSSATSTASLLLSNRSRRNPRT